MKRVIYLTLSIILCCLLSQNVFSKPAISKIKASKPGNKLIRLNLEDSPLFDVREENNPQSGFLPLHAEYSGQDLILSATLPDSGEGMGAKVDLIHSIISPNHIFLPHLAPDPGSVIGDHSFRSPAIILANHKIAVALIPNIDDIEAIQKAGLHAWLDYEHASSTITIAVGNCQTSGHVGYVSIPAAYKGQNVKLRVHVISSNQKADLDNPYALAAKWLWEQWGHPLHEKGGSQKAPISTYCNYINNWTFTPEPNGWADTVWQDFKVNGRKCGAPAFIVDVAQHPSVPLEKRRWREFKSVWNQAWFSTQRCANGLLRYARQIGSKDIENRAKLMTQFALSAPQTDGLFPGVYAAGEGNSWDNASWTNSNRRPFDTSENAYHILDSSFTARLLLEWDTLVSGDKELQDYVIRYADRLCRLQRKSGAFPGWVEPDGKVPEMLSEGPESAMSAALLLELVRKFPQHDEAPKWKKSALIALSYLEKGPVAESRWEDFETYFSCCRWGARNLIGKKVERNGIYKQNTFSPFWCAEAFLDAYHVTKDAKYLQIGKRCLDELSLYQQVWNPDYIPAECHGGFGVMNYDGEWNDSRQSLFAPIYLAYYEVTGNKEYFERGIAAMRSAFAMLYCPENEEVRKQYERVHKFFGKESYGFMMENIYHCGPGNEPIGPFTIYTWGNGAALSTSARIRDMYGDIYIDSKRKAAFGVDGCNAVVKDSEVIITDRYNRDSLLAVYDNGTRQTVKLTNSQGKLVLNP